jgi:diacylglycerol kinase (ATP)
VSGRARLIANPSSGTDDAPGHLEQLNESLRVRFGAIEIVLTLGEGDANGAARRAVEDGCELLFVAGGDGTLNEVLNGVAAVPGGLSRTTFGIVPFGTGNDVARALGIPLEIDAAIDVLLQSRALEIDLGEVNGRLFANTSSGGFIAETSEATSSQLKSVAGRLAFLVGGAQALMEFDPVPVTVSGAPGGLRFEKGMYAFAVCNSRLIGGGRLIAPDAVIDDGLLDFCFIEEMRTLEFVALLRQVADGSHVDDSRVRYAQVSALTLDFDRPMKINIDGEVLEASCCRYSVRPKAARFFAGDSPFAANA